MSIPGVKESDWKLYKSRIDNWQEHYMEKLCKEYIALLSSDSQASDRFWTLDERLKADKKKRGVLVRNSRSEMFDNIFSLICEGAITEADLDGFSDELKESMHFLLEAEKNSNSV